MANIYSDPKPVRVVTDGIPVVCVDANGQVIGDATTITSTPLPVIETDASGAVGANTVYSTPWLVTPGSTGLYVMAVDSTGVPTGNALGSVLTLDFANGNVPAMAGYSYTGHTTPIAEIDPSGGYHAFAANAVPIASGVGYWSRGAVTNLLLQSQDATNASWTRPVSFTANVATSPDGTLDADQIATTNTSATDNYQLKTLTAVTYTVARWVKKDASGTRWPYLFLGGGANALAFFDATNGTFGTVSGSAATKSTGFIATAGGYWIWLTATATATSAAYGSGWSSANTTATFANGVGGYVWQGQLVIGSDPGPIIPTTTASVTTEASVLSVTCPNGTYTATYTFDDGSTQNIGTTVSGNTFTMPPYPTLNRPLVTKVVLK